LDFNRNFHFIKEPERLQEHGVAKVLDARRKVQRVLRVFPEVYDVQAKTPLSPVRTNILFKVLQPGGAWKNNELYWRVESLQ
jgi:hypothetical protein